MSMHITRNILRMDDSGMARFSQEDASSEALRCRMIQDSGRQISSRTSSRRLALRNDKLKEFFNERLVERTEGTRTPPLVTASSSLGWILTNKHV